MKCRKRTQPADWTQRNNRGRGRSCLVQGHVLGHQMSDLATWRKGHTWTAESQARSKTTSNLKVSSRQLWKKTVHIKQEGQMVIYGRLEEVRMKPSKMMTNLTFFFFVQLLMLLWILLSFVSLLHPQSSFVLFDLHCGKKGLIKCATPSLLYCIASFISKLFLFKAFQDTKT